MYTKIVNIYLLFILSAFLFLLTSDVLFFGELPVSVESDLFELKLRRNAVRTQGLVTQEAQVSPRDSGRAFVVEYFVGDKSYTAILHTTDEDLAELYALDVMRVNLYRNQSGGEEVYPPYAPPVYIMYDRTDPNRHIVGELSGNAPLSIGNTPLSMIGYFIVLIVTLSLILAKIYELIMLGYVVNNGKRVLVELTAIRFDWRHISCGIRCKWKEEYLKVYKGECWARTVELFKEYNIKYIPMYILPDRKNVYLVNYDEAKKIIDNRSYNGHTLDELQEPNQTMVLPKTTWFSFKEVTWVDRK